jgi:hypothetical protein
MLGHAIARLAQLLERREQHGFDFYGGDSDSLLCAPGAAPDDFLRDDPGEALPASGAGQVDPILVQESISITGSYSSPRRSVDVLDVVLDLDVHHRTPFRNSGAATSRSGARATTTTAAAAM